MISQKHCYPYEVIICDDASKDRTPEIALSFAKRYPSIVRFYPSARNLGVIKNYFRAASLCTGNYIMQCAGDDWWLPGKVARQISALSADPSVSLHYGKVVNVYQESVKGRKTWGGPGKDFMALIKGNVVPAVTAAFRHDHLVQYINEIEPMDRPWLMEDYPLWLWLARKGKVIFDRTVLGAYRVKNGSASHLIEREKRESFQRSYEEIRDFFIQYAGIAERGGDLKERMKRWNARNRLLSGDRNRAIALEDLCHRGLKDTIVHIVIQRLLFGVPTSLIYGERFVIPRIIHACWFGGEDPWRNTLLRKCRDGGVLWLHHMR